MPKRLDWDPGKRVPYQRWSSFVRNHAQAIVTCDFCVAVTAAFCIFYVFVVIEHATRRILHVVVAEVLRGRCDFALKATPAEVPLAHRQLLDTQQMLAQFPIVVFDAACATVMERLQRRHRRRQRYADLMIAAIVIAGQHILVSRNQADCRDVLPPAQWA
ncbi:MAG TPA: PIN domain-containing protein, partial [Candidatus Tectomicrobia bacterium]|nr:PIN domain-containing protein [Candidatus Tectomicrobia bacterium]